MPRLLVIFAALLLIFGASACDGDDGGNGGDNGGDNGGPVASPTPESTPTLEATATMEPSPEPAIAVSRLDNAAEFLQGFADKQLIKQPCTFDEDAGQVDCAENGLYEPDPVPSDADSVCEVILADDEPVAVTCEAELNVSYYEIAP